MTPNHNRQLWLRIGSRALACTLLIAVFLCLVPVRPCAADSPDRPRRILVIPSYNFDYNGIQWFLRGVMAEFTERKPFKVTFFLENMQLAAHPSDHKYMDNMAASLKIKYSLEKPDLIIVQYRQALQFMEVYGKDIFGDVPVVFAGLSVEGYIPDMLPHGYTGIVASFSAKKNIELILQNHPDVKKIYIVAGSSPIEHNLVQEAIKEGVLYRGKVELIALNDLTFPALLEKLGKIDGNSAIIYQAFQIDAAGKVFVPAQAAIEIARATRVPVYGLLDTYMGSGITGGFLINHDGLGRRAAKIAMEWLQSGVMPDTRVKSEPIGSYQFDGRQLHRWGIREDTLPSGSKIEFKAFSVWDSYKKEILGGIFLILLQATLIVGLLRSRRKRIKTEAELRESEKRLSDITFSMGDWVWEVDKNGIYTYSSQKGYDFFGPSRKDIIGKTPFDFMPPGEAQRVAAIFSEIATNKLPIKDLENWNIGKNGEIICLLTNGVPILDKEGNLKGYRGVDKDITDRKGAEEKLEHTLESLKKAVGTTIQVMVSAIEIRDPYTAGHQTRVAKLAQAIAAEMGFSQEKIDGIRMAGFIHDIGKLSIPAEILSKPTKLSGIEFSLVKEHARQGYEILKNVESSWPLAEIVHQHHERMDGSGYPRNLKGEEILIEARILTVADVVEAMASHRPYRPGLGIDEALKEIQKNKGIFYDDAAVDACLRLFREKGFQLERG